MIFFYAKGRHSWHLDHLTTLKPALFLLDGTDSNIHPVVELRLLSATFPTQFPVTFAVSYNSKDEI